MFFLIFSFFVTATLYATAGFGGGSTYNALLMLVDTDYRLVPLISLACNILVVSSGLWHFRRKGYVDVRRILPWICFSIPAAFIGGMIPVSEKYFMFLLGMALCLSGVRMLWPQKEVVLPIFEKYSHIFPFALWTALGFLAGITGIGGGIFLAPVLHFLAWGNAKQISGACAAFIFLNSWAGLIGQSIKSGEGDILLQTYPYWPLIPAVIIGGQIGAWVGASRITKAAVKNVTAILVLYVSIRLLMKACSG